MPLDRISGYVIDSFEAAIWCLITTDSYEECMLKAVNLDEDTDTVAAIAGGLAGLYYGYLVFAFETQMKRKKIRCIYVA